MTDELAARIETIVTAALERQHLPGVSVAVARDGNVLFARGYGFRNVGERLPANPDTICSIPRSASCMTAAAVNCLLIEAML